MSNDIFFKLDATAKRLTKYLVFDTENNTKTGEFILGAAIKNGELFKFTEKEKMQSFLLSDKNRGHKLIAHNTLYDLGVLWGTELVNLFDPAKLAIKGTRLLFALRKSGNENIIFLDNFNHSFCSLEKIGDLYGMKKLEGFGMEHCVRDCEILDRYVNDCAQTYHDLNAAYKPTVAGTSLDLYRRNYFSGPGWKKLDKGKMDFMKQSYHGGLTDCYFIGKKKGNFFQYDINSQYPYIMQTTKFPFIASLEYENKLELDYDGISEIEIITDKNCAVFPINMKGKKIYFPYGNIKGIFTHNVIREAIERGATIKKWIKGIYFKNSDYIFKDYISALYPLKEKGTGVLRERAKRLLVSIYGKFGQMDTIEQYNPNTKRFENVIGDYPIWSNFIYSAIVTDESRKLLRARMGKQPYYIDTDSFLSEEKLPTSNKIGDIKLEGTFDEINIILPKSYILKKKGKIEKIKLKGIPERAYTKKGEKENIIVLSKIKNLLKGDEINYFRPVGLKTALANDDHPTRWKEDSKRIIAHYDKRLIKSNGETEPLYLDMFNGQLPGKDGKHGKKGKTKKDGGNG
jgi:hypothetical protein